MALGVEGLRQHSDNVIGYTTATKQLFLYMYLGRPIRKAVRKVRLLWYTRDGITWEALQSVSLPPLTEPGLKMSEARHRYRRGE